MYIIFEVILTKQNFIAVCNLGYTRDSNNCVKCPTGGFYKDEKGPGACKECPIQSPTVPVDGAMSLLACGKLIPKESEKWWHEKYLVLV